MTRCLVRSRSRTAHSLDGAQCGARPEPCASALFAAPSGTPIAQPPRPRCPPMRFRQTRSAAILLGLALAVVAILPAQRGGRGLGTTANPFPIKQLPFESGFRSYIVV